MIKATRMFVILLFIVGCSSSKTNLDNNTTQSASISSTVDYNTTTKNENKKLPNIIKKVAVVKEKQKSIVIKKVAVVKESHDSKIASLFMLGFDGTTVSKKLKGYLKNGLGGVILYKNNIKDHDQLKKLTGDLLKIKPDLLIAIDQEGGNVKRLSQENGFYEFELRSAQGMKDARDTIYSQIAYANHGKLLKYYNINMNLAPVVDLSINPKNTVVVKNKRTYSSNPDIVTDFAKTAIEGYRESNIITSLKHFPGHGSSTKDSHKSFVDISNTWSIKELEPYYNLIKSNQVDTIMVGHLYNRFLDERFPSSLSKQTIELLLRKFLSYDGVVISDDIQMHALSNKYSFREVIRNSINAGVNMIIIAQNGKYPKNLNTIVNITNDLIIKKEISILKINDSCQKLKKLKKALVISK